MINMIKQKTEFSNDIKMGLGIDECKTMALKKRKQEYYDEPIITNKEEKVMKALSSGETYKYLGMEQSRMTEVGIIKDRLKKEFEKRLPTYKYYALWFGIKRPEHDHEHICTACACVFFWSHSLE